MITVESSNIPCLTRKVDIITKNLLIINASGDLKKIWLLINQLRRKQRRTLKAVNIIDNKRIIERKVIANEFKNILCLYHLNCMMKLKSVAGDISNFFA